MTVVVSVLILAATVLLFSEKELASKWGVDILEEGGLVAAHGRGGARRRTRVAELSRTYRLSPREQEVLALLAEGKTGRVIQQELFIAEGTFKAHTRHIYEKMGINSRKELFELLGLSLVAQPQLWLLIAHPQAAAGRAAQAAARAGFLKRGEKPVDTGGIRSRIDELPKGGQCNEQICSAT